MNDLHPWLSYKEAFYPLPMIQKRNKRNGKDKTDKAL